ncbi:MAG: hypothetical protein M0Z77_07160 [Thermoplasmatales archaeon]|nr:hypothetical protein [Thermoplasmatales archaeon]
MDFNRTVDGGCSYHRTWLLITAVRTGVYEFFTNSIYSSVELSAADAILNEGVTGLFIIFSGVSVGETSERWAKCATNSKIVHIFEESINSTISSIPYFPHP